MWWLSKILNYSRHTEQERMQGNLMDDGFEVPTMNILIKDHKSWSPTSNKPVPSRPVVNGRKGLNTHLSEIISEILEPIALEMEGGKVQSTEEALAIVDIFNKEVENGTDISKKCCLNNILQGDDGTTIYNCAPEMCRARQESDQGQTQNFNDNFNSVSDSPLRIQQRQKRKILLLKREMKLMLDVVVGTKILRQRRMMN